MVWPPLLHLKLCEAKRKPPIITAPLTLFSHCGSPSATQIPVPPEFSKTDTTEFDDVASDAYSPELQASEWGNEENTSPDAKNLPEFYSNGITTPAEVDAAPAFGDQDNPLLESSIPTAQESPPPAG